MVPRTLAFVIGAQRSGTTWLHDYLKNHPEVSTGLAKEGNYFAHLYRGVDDPRYDAAGSSRRALPLPRRVRAAKSVLVAGGHPRVRALRAAALRGDFVGFFGTGAHAPVLADVSSYYSLLDAEAYRAMAAAHPETRFILLLRDPVARAWSDVNWRAGGDASAAAERALDEGGIPARSDYGRMLDVLDAAVPDERKLVLFHEHLFTDTAMARLTDFLGITFCAGDYGRAVNTGGAGDAPEAWAAQMRSNLAPVYDVVRARFGDRVPSVWRD